MLVELRNGRVTSLPMQLSVKVVLSCSLVQPACSLFVSQKNSQSPVQARMPTLEAVNQIPLTGVLDVATANLDNGTRWTRNVWLNADGKHAQSSSGK